MNTGVWRTEGIHLLSDSSYSHSELSSSSRIHFLSSLEKETRGSRSKSSISEGKTTRAADRPSYGGGMPRWGTSDSAIVMFWSCVGCNDLHASGKKDEAAPAKTLNPWHGFCPASRRLLILRVEHLSFFLHWRQQCWLSLSEYILVLYYYLNMPIDSLLQCHVYEWRGADCTWIETITTKASVDDIWTSRWPGLQLCGV